MTDKSNNEIHTMNTECGESKDKKGVCEVGPQTPIERRDTAFEIRENAAKAAKDLPLSDHPCNNDENIYANKIGNFSKGLPHNDIGEVDIAAYNKLLLALSTGNQQQFEQIPMGGVMKFVSPQAAYAFDLIGQDSHQPQVPPPPALNTAWAAAEMVELYWQSLTRDVPFTDYETNPLIHAAACELSHLCDFHGPKDENCDVTPENIYRSNLPGEVVGPYVSQFLYSEFPYGSIPIHQKQVTVLPTKDNDFMTTYDKWLKIQNGAKPTAKSKLDPDQRYIRNGRDLAQWVHYDFSFTAQLNACLILLGIGPDVISPNNPYFHSKTQTGFVDFGGPHFLDFCAKAPRPALECAWFTKWLVQRRLRPEAFGGLVENTKTGKADYPISCELLNSQAVAETFKKFGSYLLPQAYPEGCPLHPAYPSGHATFAGAGVTILKAFFNEKYVFPNPVQANTDGSELVPYVGAPLTVGGELNKLAWNVAMGRAWAGIHYRTDFDEGLKIGEAYAIDILQSYCATYNETAHFTFTKFDGTVITIC